MNCLNLYYLSTYGRVVVINTLCTLFDNTQFFYDDELSLFDIVDKTVEHLKLIDKMYIPEEFYVEGNKTLVISVVTR